MSIEIFAVASLITTAAYLYAGDFERYSTFTVGVFQRVSHEPAALDGNQCREHWCDTTSGDGEYRQWFKEIVLLGAPVASYGGGSGYYCGDHAHVTIQNGQFEESRSVPDSVVWAIVWVAEKFATDVETPEQSVFENVQNDITSNASAAMSLVPVALLVVFAAASMKTLEGLR